MALNFSPKTILIVKLLLIVLLTSLLLALIFNEKFIGYIDPAQKNASKESANGIDVSHYQGIINWKKVGNANIDFAYIKASSGDTYTDPHFIHNWNGVRTTKIYRGAYHFFLADDDPQQQAKHYINTIGSLGPHDLPPMLDVEILDHRTKAQVASGALAWLKAIEKATGRTPVIYTGSNFGSSVLSNPDFARYPLWIADYGKRINSIPEPWKHSGWTIWQHSETGKVEGISTAVDLNRFHADVSALKAFIKQSQSD